MGSEPIDIRGKESPRRERSIAGLATRQNGVVTHAQLVRLGYGPQAIEYRRGAGRLHRVHKGVYAVGRPTLDLHGRWMAAVLACGGEAGGAVLSHLDAAALWEILPSSGRAIHVTARRSRHGAAGIRVHRVRSLHPEDRTDRAEIPVTTVPRTLLDLADVVRRDRLERAFEEAERRRVLDVRAVERVLARSQGRRGLGPLSDLLQSRLGPPPDTRSELERRFWDLCRTAGLPMPPVNVAVEGIEVDAVWTRERLVVELDGYAFHRTRAAFERDRERDAALQLAGYRILRITHRRLEREPARVVETIRSLLLSPGAGA